ncbi:hypothetical protein [Candidatus Epulonipiscium viviparus]|uniref:hypothetical protein n=1 Tax=Candidatus Epulonipiscium viviparus TaxID=420336 RepID=UPI002738133D|nr:hypothetical protein [Candidatus Epulopiscium viviparus]
MAANKGAVNLAEVVNKKLLNFNVLVVGSAGAGKTTAICHLIDMVDAPCMIFETKAGEYKHLLSNNVIVGTSVTPLKINPFKFPEGIAMAEHIDRLMKVFELCWGLDDVQSLVLAKAIRMAYAKAGCGSGKTMATYPTFIDVSEALGEMVSIFDSRLKITLLDRVSALSAGIFTRVETDAELLYNNTVIIDLNNIYPAEMRNLMMHMLTMKTVEYWMSNKTLKVKHMTIFDQITESESVIKLLKEAQRYGLAFIVAAAEEVSLNDIGTVVMLRSVNPVVQAELSSMKVIAVNTELAKLKTGVAVVYQAGTIKSCRITPYTKSTENKVAGVARAKIVDVDKGDMKVLLSFLLYRRLNLRGAVNLAALSQNLELLPLSSVTVLKINELIEEYRDTATLAIWERYNFDDLSSIVTELMAEVGAEIEFEKNEDANVLDAALRKKIVATIGLNETDYVNAVMHCIMKEMSTRDSKYFSVYAKWRESL